jgi:hypothetical protein
MDYYAKGIFYRVIIIPTPELDRSFFTRACPIGQVILH